MAKNFKVWSHFTSPKNPDLKFRITELPIEYVDNALELIMKYFVEEEHVLKASGVAKNEDAMAEIRRMFKELIVTGVNYSMVCTVDDGSGEIQDMIAAASMVSLVKPHEPGPKIEPKAIELKHLFNYLSDIVSKKNEMVKHYVEPYYDDKGVVVHPDYRGNGIAQELLKARRILCKEHGVRTTVGWMTSPGTQKAAVRDGWETVFDINPRYNASSQMIFDEDAPNLKFMIGHAYHP